MPKPTSRQPSPYAEALLIAALAALAVLARWAGWREKTDDMNIFFQWYNQMKANGGLQGLGTEIGNYNAPFLYCLWAVMHLPGPLILKIKAVWCVFDVVLAVFAYKVVALHRPGRRIPAIAALVTVLLPTVVLNASLLGQVDAMWAAFAVGGVYYLLRDRPWLGVALCGISLAFKPQGIFIFPLLLLLALAGKIKWRTLLAAPAVFVALDLPAILLGRDPFELLTIYDMDRQSRNVRLLTHRAPSIFTFIPDNSRGDSLRTLGYILAAAVVLGVIYVLVVRAVEWTRPRIVLAAAFFSLLLPYLLPGMHERYFYLADVLTLMLAFYRPRLWYVAALVQAGSLLSYVEYLATGSPKLLPMAVPATLMLAALLILGYRLLSEAFTDPPAPVAETPVATSVRRPPTTLRHRSRRSASPSRILSRPN
jgi:Gpi18-like mannosyltransferase